MRTMRRDEEAITFPRAYPQRLRPEVPSFSTYPYPFYPFPPVLPPPPGLRIVDRLFDTDGPRSHVFSAPGTNVAEKHTEGGGQEALDCLEERTRLRSAVGGCGGGYTPGGHRYYHTREVARSPAASTATEPGTGRLPLQATHGDDDRHDGAVTIFRRSPPQVPRELDMELSRQQAYFRDSGLTEQEQRSLLERLRNDFRRRRADKRMRSMRNRTIRGVESSGEAKWGCGGASSPGTSMPEGPGNHRDFDLQEGDCTFEADPRRQLVHYGVYLDPLY